MTEGVAQRERPLSVAMVVPPWYEVPSLYGGLEASVAILIDALVARGNDVTLFGAGTSTGTAARFASTTPELQYERMGQILPEVTHVARVQSLLADGDFDVVHDHTLTGLLVASQRSSPTVVTVHSPVGGKGHDSYGARLRQYLEAAADSAWLVAVSDAQRRDCPELPWIDAVHHGMPVDDFPFGSGGQPAVWLARFTSDKGPDLAISACREAKVPLILAGKCDLQVEKEYFDEVIQPMLGDDTEVIFSPGREKVHELLAAARCLVLPIRWQEPFGMVYLEAMACGTPVVTMRRGAAPEVVRDGVTGFVCDDPAQLADALRRVETLDRGACRDHVTREFSPDLTASRYEKVYREAIARKRNSP